MPNHYMTVLGTGNYSECDYAEFDNKNEIIKQKLRTCYAQSAVFSFFCSNFEDGDRFTVFVTKESRKKHLDNFSEDIRKVFGDRNIDFEIVDICEGLNTEDQWRNFNIIFDAINKGENITVDITHGFRTIPMQLFSILNYARTLKNITVDGVYYGVFEQPFGFLNETYIPYDELQEKYVVSERQKKYSEEVSLYYPVVDYTGYLTISELSNAAFTFAETGDAGTFARITERSKIKRVANPDATPEAKKEFLGLFALGSDLNNITESVKCVRGKNEPSSPKPNERSEKSIYQAVRKYEKDISSGFRNSNENTEYGALMNIISYMDDVVKENFGEITGEELTGHEANVKTGICVIRWCIKYGLVQAGFTALEETVISWINNLAGDDYIRNQTGGKLKESRELRDVISKLSNEYEQLKQPENKDEPTEIYSCFMEDFKEYGIESLIKLLGSIKQSRNDMNHFGFSNHIRKSSKLKNQLKEYYQEFLNTTNIN